MPLGNNVELPSFPTLVEKVREIAGAVNMLGEQQGALAASVQAIYMDQQATNLELTVMIRLLLESVGFNVDELDRRASAAFDTFTAVQAICRFLKEMGRPPEAPSTEHVPSLEEWAQMARKHQT